MSQTKRKRKQVASTLDPELWEGLRAFSDQSRIPASRLLDEAIEDLLVKYQKAEPKNKAP